MNLADRARLKKLAIEKKLDLRRAHMMHAIQSAPPGTFSAEAAYKAFANVRRRRPSVQKSPAPSSSPSGEEHED